MCELTLIILKNGSQMSNGRLRPDQNLPCFHYVTSRSCGQRLSVSSKRQFQKTVIVTIFVHYKRRVGGGVKSLPALGRKNALLHKTGRV